MFTDCLSFRPYLNGQRKNSTAVKERKGRLIHITGEQTLRSYTDREGVERMSADISILNWHYAGTKPKSDEAETTSQNGSAASQRPVGKVHEEQTIPGGDEDDDLPI